jgi:hypothetical protein
MNKPKAFIVVSRYKEDVNWIKELTDDYVIYNKGEPLGEGFNERMLPNFGGNQYDIFKFIHDNYENLPDLIAFVQGNPFDHCLKERFDKLIHNTYFTRLFGDKNYLNGVYSEENNSWYINGGAHNTGKPPSKFSSFGEYANHIFEDYTHVNVLDFPPGSQLIVEKQRCLFYSKAFWKKLMDVIPNQIGLNGGREAHIVERSMQIIFENRYKERI